MKKLLSSCFACVSSAVLASSFTLFFAPEAAMAFRLINSDNDNFIDGIEDLAIDGSLFNVDFQRGTAESVYQFSGSGLIDFDFEGAESALLAAEALLAALDGAPIEDQNGSNVRSLRIPTTYVSGLGTSGVDLSRGAIINDGSVPNFRDGELVFAIFDPAEPAAPTPEPTPEPSLILGFITLSGLMLGSKRKTKG